MARDPLQLQPGLARLNDLNKVVNPHLILPLLPLEQLLGLDIHPKHKLNLLLQPLHLILLPHGKEDLTEDLGDLVLVDGLYFLGAVGQQRREALVYDVPEAVDGQFSVVVVVFQPVEIEALPEAVQAEDNADPAEEVIVGHV